MKCIPLAQLALVTTMLFAISQWAHAQGETPATLTYDPASGNYIIRYEGLLYNEDGDIDWGIMHEVVFEPATKVDPAVRAVVMRESDRYQYEYQVTNGASSQQRLESFAVEHFASFEDVRKPDETWNQGAYRFAPLIDWAELGNHPKGFGTPYDGIAPDSSEAGFSFVSRGLPSIVTAYFQGRTGVLAFPDEPPPEVKALLRPLRKFPADYVLRRTVGPRAVPDPLDGLVFIDTLSTYVAEAAELDWITDAAVRADIETHLADARNALAAADSAAARQPLADLVSLAQTSSAMTSEAQALFRFNAEYLLARLPTPPDDGRTCAGLAATVYVDAGGVVRGGALDGETFTGTLTGTTGSDIIVGTDGDDILIGRQGDDILCGLGGTDLLRGSAGADSLYGGAGSDELRGDNGEDALFGGDGNDLLLGGAGNDMLDGGGGDDDLRGAAGDDLLSGSEGDDDLRGNGGRDDLHGGSGNDSLEGGDGDDTLIGGAGTDEARGGGGVDACDAETELSCESDPIDDLSDDQ